MPQNERTMDAVAVLAIGFCCWGKGKTLDEAIDNCRKSACSEARKQKLVVYISDDPDVCVSGLGDVVWKNGKRVQRIGTIPKWR